MNAIRLSTKKQFVSVSIDSVNHAAWVGGFGARQLVVRCGGRPQWSPSRKAWATSETIATDVLALCDARSIPVKLKSIGGE